MHNTHNHKCDMCESNQILSFIDLKCANCDKKHYAKDASCEFCSTIAIDQPMSCKEY